MKLRFPLIAVLVVLMAPVAFAQNATYSFDNFDTSNGIKIHTPAMHQQMVSKPALGSK
jgi:hypothetical protein